MKKSYTVNVKPPNLSSDTYIFIYIFIYIYIVVNGRSDPGPVFSIWSTGRSLSRSGLMRTVVALRGFEIEIMLQILVVKYINSTTASQCSTLCYPACV